VIIYQKKVVVVDKGDPPFKVNGNYMYLGDNGIKSSRKGRIYL